MITDVAEATLQAAVPRPSPQLERVPTRRLIGRCLAALIHPFRAIRAITPDHTPIYPTLIPALSLGGVFFIVFHTRFVIGTWVWRLPYAPMIVAQFAMASVWNWLIGGIALTYTFRWAGSVQPTRGQIDIAVLYLWLTWIIMPLFDIAHGYGLPTKLLINQLPWAYFFVGHTSSLIMAPIRAIQLYGILRFLGKMSRARACVLAVILPFAARFLIEPTGAFFFLIAQRFGYHVSLWVGQHLMLVGSLLYSIWWRLTLERFTIRRRLGHVAVTAAILCIITGVAWASSVTDMMPGVRPLPYWLPSQTIRLRPRLQRSSSRREWRWRDAASSQGVYEIGPLLDGIEHRQVVRLPLTGLHQALPQNIDRVECQVQVIAHDGLTSDGLPWVGCALASSSMTAGASELFDIARETVTETTIVHRVWDPHSRDWSEIIQALRNGTAEVHLALGLHGAGDYTQPDLVRISGVVLTVESSTPVAARLQGNDGEDSR